MSKENVIDNIRFNFKFWIETTQNEGILGDKKCELLKTINKLGNLKEALNAHGLTYRKTWNNLNRIEKKLGFQLIERQRGGKSGGKTYLTDEGKIILNSFNNLHLKLDKLINESLQEAHNEINQQLKNLYSHK